MDDAARRAFHVVPVDDSAPHREDAECWCCPQEVVDKGVEYRARIAALTPDATTEGTHE